MLRLRNRTALAIPLITYDIDHAVHCCASSCQTAEYSLGFLVVCCMLELLVCVGLCMEVWYTVHTAIRAFQLELRHDTRQYCIQTRSMQLSYARHSISQ
jgi:hypothetical protein